MPRRKRNLEAIGGHVRQTVHAIGPEVVILPLLAIADDRRAGRLETDHSVPDSVFVQRLERWIKPIYLSYRVDKFARSGNAANRLCWNCHRHALQTLTTDCHRSASR